MASSQVIVTGFIDPETLAANVHRRTRKQASIVPEEEKKEEEGEKKDDNGDEEKMREEEEEKKEEEGMKDDISKYEYWPSSRDYVEYAYTPQTFSDENPNACSVM